jgi:hypothetical protein
MFCLVLPRSPTHPWADGGRGTWPRRAEWSVCAPKDGGNRAITHSKIAAPPRRPSHGRGSPIGFSSGHDTRKPPARSSFYGHVSLPTLGEQRRLNGLRGASARRRQSFGDWSRAPADAAPQRPRWPHAVCPCGMSKLPPRSRFAIVRLLNRPWFPHLARTGVREGLRCGDATS